MNAENCSWLQNIVQYIMQRYGAYKWNFLNMKTWSKMLAILVFQLCFVLASCRHEILSYDKPQDAMRDETAKSEMSDNPQDILVIGKSLISISLSMLSLRIF